MALNRASLGPIILCLAAAAACLIYLASISDSLQEVGSDQLIEWSAIEPDASVPLRPWRNIIIHHSATAKGSTAGIDHDHSSRRDDQGEHWDGIGYHFVIGNGKGMPLGQCDATFRWRSQRHGAHAGSDDYNQFGIGIVLIGNLDRKPPPKGQLDRCAHLCALLISHLRTLDGPDSILGHRDIKGTACPGRYCNLKALRQRVAELLPIYEQQRQGATPPAIR